MKSASLCHLSFSSLDNSSRLLREAETALEQGLARRVVCVGYDTSGPPPRETRAPGLETVKLTNAEIGFLPRVLRRTLAWAFWNLLAVRFARREHFDIIQVHSLAALAAGVWLKLRSGGKTRLIYDAHELETEREGWGSVQKAVARLMERPLIQYADHIFVVGDMIRDWYISAYGLTRISVLRNVPREPETPIRKNRRLRDAFGISDDPLAFIYVGLIDNGRGYRQIVDAFQKLPGHHVIFLGYGSGVNHIQEAAKQSRNIHWHPPVPMHEVSAYAAGCDVGLSLIEDTCLSYRYCLPNKLHESRLAGLPVIVSDLPEMARFVDEARCGWKVAPDAESLRRLIATLDRPAIEAKLAGISQPPLTWRTEQTRYTAVLQELLR